MSIRKYFRAISLSAALLGGCQDAQSLGVLDSIHQNGMGGYGYGDGNNILLHGVTLQTDPSTFEPTLLLTEIVKSQGLKGYDHYANLVTARGKVQVLIEDLVYEGPAVTEKVAELNTDLGWLVATDVQGSVHTVNEDSSLTFRIGSPYDYDMRIKFASDAGKYAKYSISYLDKAAGSWLSACSLYGGIMTDMIAVGGLVWDETTAQRTADYKAITLSCTHDAIGGPILWGYDIWSHPKHHQAASRMKRLDICGDGQSITYRNHGIEGSTRIRIFDDIVLHPIAEQTPSTVEAYWGEDGAICVNPDWARDLRLQPAIEDQLVKCPKPLCNTINYNSAILPVGSSQP